MPTGLRFTQITENNLGKNLEEKKLFNQQINMWNEDKYSKEGSITYLGKSEFGNYDKYIISFFEKDSVSGYYKDTYVEGLLVKVDKVFFVSNDSKYILVKASKKDATKIISLLTENKFIKRKNALLDTKELQEKLSCDQDLTKSISGAYFKDIENVNINTIGIWGSDIDQSEEFREYASQEDSIISMLMINFGSETIGITPEYGAVFYNRRNEENLLKGYDFVIKILKKLDMFIY